MRIGVGAALLLLALASWSCGGGAPPPEGGPRPGDEPTPSAATGPLYFVDATKGSGLDGFRQVNGAPLKPHIIDSVGGGVAFLDHDGDGDLDVYLTNGSRLEGFPPGQEPRDALFENQGDGTFRDVTEGSGLGDTAWTNGVVVADVDGDGRQDLYLTNYGPNVLLRNRGDGSFEDVTAEAGVAGDSWSTGAAFFDADGDLDLDLYVANYVDFDPGFQPADPSLCEYRGHMVFYGPKGLRPAGDRLYRNDGGRFTDVTEESGIVNAGGFGFQVLTFDADEDGDLDVFVANDSTANYLWKNDGSGHFSESGLLGGMALSESGKEQGSMGAALGDYDHDGRLDVYITNFAEDYYTLYRNQGKGFFSDTTFRLDLGEGTYSSLGWGCSFFDPDNDGDLDLFASNGHVYPQVDEFDFGQTYLQKNQLFEQVEGGRFVERTTSAGPGFLVEASSRGSAVGDYDDDGDLDLIVSNLDGAPTLLRNDGTGTGAWIKVRLEAPAPNTEAIGALVTVEAGGIQRVKPVLSSNSFLSVDDRRLHFGLGDGFETASAEVRWPDGSVERFEGLATRRLHRLRQGEGSRRTAPSVR